MDTSNHRDRPVGAASLGRGSITPSADPALVPHTSRVSYRPAQVIDWQIGIITEGSNASALAQLKQNKIRADIIVYAPPQLRLSWTAIGRSLGNSFSLSFLSESSWEQSALQTFKWHEPRVLNLVTSSATVFNELFFTKACKELEGRLSQGGIIGFPAKISRGYSRGWKMVGAELGMEILPSPQQEMLDGLYAWPTMVIVGGPVWEEFDPTKGKLSDNFWSYVRETNVPITELWGAYISLPHADNMLLTDVKPSFKHVQKNKKYSSSLKFHSHSNTEEKPVSLADSSVNIEPEKSLSTSWCKHLSLGLILGPGINSGELSQMKQYFKTVLREGVGKFSLEQSWGLTLRKYQAHAWILSQKVPPVEVVHRLANAFLARRHLDFLLDPESQTVFFHANLIRWISKIPAWSQLENWITQVRLDGAQIGVLTEDERVIILDEGRIPLCWADSWPLQPMQRGLRVAVMSMCGVSSFQDRYGLGGEHQVVHWLREDMLADPRVELCDIYDRANSGTLPSGYYDIIFSNACWIKAPKPAEGGLTILWHFNTDSGDFKDPNLIVQLGWDWVWTNSRVQLAELTHLMKGRCRLVDLNASFKHHFPVSQTTSIFCHDVCYVGGYQAYKGKERIDLYLKPLLNQEFDFAIYGNSLWQHAVQKEAQTKDPSFLDEYLDTSWDQVYHGILHPDDYRHLARSTKIWVNFNASDQFPLGMVNDRVIWGLRCGAFFITDDTPAQRELYGDIVEYSTGGDDLLEKVRYWLQHPEEREAKARRGPGFIDQQGLTTRGTVQKILNLYAELKEKDNEPKA